MDRTTATTTTIKPGSPVDVRYVVSDWTTREKRVVWVSGNQIFDPDYQVSTFKGNQGLNVTDRRKPRLGEVLITSRQGTKPIRCKLENLRPHDPKTSLPFDQVFGSSGSGSVSLVGISATSDDEDLQLGIEPQSEDDDW